MKGFIIRAFAGSNPCYVANLDIINREAVARSGAVRYWSPFMCHAMRFADEESARIVCELLSERGQPSGARSTFQLIACGSPESELWRTVGVYAFKGAGR